MSRPSSGTITSRVVARARDNISPSGPLSTPLASVTSYSGNLSKPSTESSVFSCAPPTIMRVMIWSTRIGFPFDIRINFQMCHDQIIAIQIDPLVIVHARVRQDLFDLTFAIEKKRRALEPEAHAAHGHAPFDGFGETHDHRLARQLAHARNDRHRLFDVVE